MPWREFLNEAAEAEVDALPVDIRARFVRVKELIESHGLERVGEPHVKHLHDKLWEMRMKGKTGLPVQFTSPRQASELLCCGAS